MSSLSPCVRLCELDPITGLCRGCGRTVAEITAWPGLSEADRRAIMARLPGRTAGTAEGPADEVAR